MAAAGIDFRDGGCRWANVPDSGPMEGARLTEARDAPEVLASDDDLLLYCTMFISRRLRAQYQHIMPNSLAFTLECVSVARSQD